MLPSTRLHQQNTPTSNFPCFQVPTKKGAGSGSLLVHKLHQGREKCGKYLPIFGNYLGHYFPIMRVILS